MKNRKDGGYRIGTGAASMILILICVSLSVVGVLSLIAARNDAGLTRRAVEMTSYYYSASAEAEEIIMQIDEAVLRAGKCDGEAAYWETLAASLPDGVMMDGGIAAFTVPAGEGRTLHVAVALSDWGDTGTRINVIEHSLRSESEWEFDPAHKLPYGDERG